MTLIPVCLREKYYTLMSKTPAIPSGQFWIKLFAKKNSLCTAHMKRLTVECFFHVSSVQAPANVVVRTCDTDCLVIGIGCRSNLDSGLKIWIETGLQTKSTLRYISIDQICDDLGESLCRALPAYHAFTGCDYTSSFCRRGKVQPFKKLETDVASQLAFSRLGKEDLENLDEVFHQLEQFASSMYTKKKIKKINEVRTDLFLQKYKHKDKEKISCAKKLDGSTLPPCSRVLYKKCKRTWYVARLWISSTSAIPDARKPEDYGWTLQDGAYKIIWFEGDASPRALDIVCEENSQTDEQADESEDPEENNTDADNENEPGDSDTESDDEQLDSDNDDDEDEDDDEDDDA